jgi:SAM-dependent methyltransferase
MMTGDSTAGDTGQYDSNFPRMRDELYAAIRREAFGEDIGQYSWLTADDHGRFLKWLGVDASTHVLEVATGSGGPTLHMARVTGCNVVGLEMHADGVAAANAATANAGLSDRVRFVHGDARKALPFTDATFDAALCLDSINHFYDRTHLLREWHRVVRPGGRVLFTNPITVTGLITREEMLIRSGSMGDFVFTPAGVDQQLLTDAGFIDIHTDDVTASEARVASTWLAARERAASQLKLIEGHDGFASMQRFLETVANLAAEARLSRYVYHARRP